MSSASVLPPSQNIGYTFVSALSYGLYLSTFFVCLRWLLFEDHGCKLRRVIKWNMFSIALLLCVLLTGSKALDLQTSMMQVMDDGAEETQKWMEVVSCTSLAFSTLLVDGTLIHRCYVIYNRSLRIILFPVLLWVGGLALTGLQAYCQITQDASKLKKWNAVNISVGPGTVLMPFWASTILLNGYATYMIVRCIYHVAKDSAGQSKDSIHQLKFVMRILIESGALYLAAAIAQFASWWTSNAYAIYVISGINISITGIAFNLIIIRVAQRRVDETVNHSESTAPPTSDMQFKPTQTIPQTETFRVFSFIDFTVHSSDESKPLDVSSMV